MTNNLRNQYFEQLIAFKLQLQQLTRKYQARHIGTQPRNKLKKASSCLSRITCRNTGQKKTLNLIKESIDSLNMFLATVDSWELQVKKLVEILRDRLFAILPSGEFIQLELIPDWEYLDLSFSLPKKKAPSRKENFYRELLSFPEIKSYNFSLF